MDQLSLPPGTMGAIEACYEPVFTDRHGFVPKPGSTVTKIVYDTRFVVTTVKQLGHSPVVWSLDDGNGTSVGTSLVMIDDAEQDERASFCKRCFNHSKQVSNMKVAVADAHRRRALSPDPQGNTESEI